MNKSLTLRDLKKRIAKKARIPETVVANVLDLAIEEIRRELLAQGSILLRGAFKISTSTKKVVSPKSKLPIDRVILTIRPVRGFRTELNLLTTTRATIEEPTTEVSFG